MIMTLILWVDKESIFPRSEQDLLVSSLRASRRIYGIHQPGGLFNRQAPRLDYGGEQHRC